MRLNITLNFDISVENTQLKTITKGIGEILHTLISQIINSILLAFAEEYMSKAKKPVCCDRCGNNKDFIWKSKCGRQTKLQTIFSIIFLNQLQWQCKTCGHKFFITRRLLEVEPRKIIPYDTIRKLGLIGALTSYRVSEKIVSMFGCALNKMAVWRAVQKIGKEIDFSLDPDEQPIAEADGTGIPIRGVKKRGKELKVVVQLKKGGGVKIAGLSIGAYEGGWDTLFAPMISTIKSFKKFVLITDGDTSILKGLGSILNIILQRCLWHIPHQLKYRLWMDKAPRKSTEWLHIMAKIFDICSTRAFIEEAEIKDEIIDSKLKRLDDLIIYCFDKGFQASARYLENARSDLFSALQNKFNHTTTSHVERVMRTVNLRINNRGKWSTNGSLNACKIRLAYYHNGFEA